MTTIDSLVVKCKRLWTLEWIQKKETATWKELERNIGRALNVVNINNLKQFEHSIICAV